jgi:hypothetical protein
MPIIIPNNRVGPPVLRQAWRQKPQLPLAQNAPGTVPLPPMEVEVYESSPTIITANTYFIQQVKLPNPHVGPPALRKAWRQPPQLRFDPAGIDISPALQEVIFDEIIISLPGMDNIRGGIKSGYTTTVDVPIRGGIRGGQTVPIRGGIAIPFTDPPTNPLAIHLGQGVIFFAFGHPAPEKVDHYELYASLSLGGQYTKYPQGEFNELHGMIQNVPIGITIYFQLRAVGINGADSTFVQVKKGKTYNPLVSMKVRAIRGSKIKSGATFNAVDQETGRLIVIRAPAEILIN